MQSRKSHRSGCLRLQDVGRQQRFPRNTVEGMAQPAGYSTMARAQGDGPVIWEALSVLHERDSSGGRSERGEPELGREAVQGVGGPNRSNDLGERQALGPERAKAARAGVNFRGAT